MPKKNSVLIYCAGCGKRIKFIDRELYDKGSYAHPECFDEKINVPYLGDNFVRTITVRRETNHYINFVTNYERK